VVAVSLHKEYSCHLVRENGKTLFVTSGIGTSRLPVRFLNPPEIVLVTLRSGAAGQG
jgi:predicted MPP superfamily phosphohydrolase